MNEQQRDALPLQRTPGDAKVAASNDQITPATSNRTARRLLFKAMITAVPVVLTLRGRSAWAGDWKSHTSHK
jgi:hypothetical protein